MNKFIDFNKIRELCFKFWGQNHFDAEFKEF